MPASNLREIILDILLTIFKDGVYSNIAIHNALEKVQYFSKRDRAFITKVCEGTVERLIELDYCISRYSTLPVPRMKPVIQNILRMSTYQILYMDSVPNASAVNEAVRLAQTRGFYNLKGFVNGVLRNIVRNAGSIEYPSAEKEPVSYLSVTYSVPEWLAEAWLKEYGMIVAEKMFASFLEVKPTTIRLKTSRVNRADILNSLRNQGVTVKKAPYLPYAYNISDYNYLPALDAFMKGLIFPQDVSSMLVAEAAAPRQGDYVIDVCAAPGGKNVTRADLINIRPVVMDALMHDQESEEKADIVICDLPCSGLGVIGRKADIKYRITPAKIQELQELQRRILHNAVSYVRPGGTLIYSTCTVSRMENEENVRWLTENYPLTPDSLDPYLPHELHRHTTAEGYLQLVPGIHECDGFFIARFRKNE